MISDAQAQEIISGLIEKHGFVETVRRVPANKGLIYRVWKEGMHSPTVREALDLPPKTVEVPPCPDCGEVHEQLHTCTDELQQQRSRPKRYRMHYEAGYGPEGKAQREQLEAEMKWTDCESFTEYVDYLRGWRSDLVQLSELTEANHERNVD